MNTIKTTGTENFFELFSLPESFELDLISLKKSYKNLQTKYHPDQFSNASEQERMSALSMSSQINDAFVVLSEPVKRATYLMELAGINFQEDRSVNHEILIEQIELRERLEQFVNIEDVDKKEEALESFHEQIQTEFEQASANFSKQDKVEEKPFSEMKQTLSRMLFLNKLLKEIDAQLEELD
jgi:molecular chaperone HscB